MQQPQQARPQPQQRTGDDQGFTTIQGAPATAGESIPATTLVGVAYGFIWLVVLLYLVLLWRRSQHIERELDELRRRISSASAEPRFSGEASRH